MNLPMQVDRMFSTEAAITIKQNKKGEGYIYTKNSAINGRTNGCKKKRNCRRADRERRKKITYLNYV